MAGLGLVLFLLPGGLPGPLLTGVSSGLLSGFLLSGTAAAIESAGRGFGFPLL